MQAEWQKALAGGVTVITASARLARRLREDYDAAQLAAGRRLWAEPPIFAWEGWMGALCGACPDGRHPPYVATAGQEAAMWRQIIRAERGAGEARALAVAAGEAWRLSQEWRIAPEAAATAETDAFAAWESALRRELLRRDWLTAAQLPDWIRGQLRPGPPGLAIGPVMPLGFQLMTPQQREFFAAWRAAGGTVQATPPAAAGACAVAQSGFGSEQEEAEAAAAWARRALEAGASRLGIVVLDLARRREQLERACTLALAPGAWLPGGGTEGALHLTLGSPLAEHPVIAAALRLLRALAAGADLAMAEVEALVLSPYLPGAGAERAGRGRAAMELSQARQLSLSLSDILRVAGRAEVGAPQLTARLRAARRATDRWPQRQSASDWAKALSAAVRAAGWPGEGLDSGEFQAAGKWPELLEELSRLGAVLPELTAEKAVAELEALAAARTFQPEAGAAAVTVLSPEASAGEKFDGIWVMGLEAAVWPPAARLNPWLPAAAQRTAGLPWTTPDGARQWAGEIMARLRASAAQLIASYAPRKDTEIATPSPLIADLPPYGAAPAAQWPRDLPAAATEAIPDEPVARAGQAGGGAIEIEGGAAVFTDQSQCPFRAFARHRLGAEEFDSAASGLDAKARGELLHDVLRRIFRDLAGPEGRVEIPGPEACAARARAAATAAVAAAQGKPAMAVLGSPAFAALEADRLAQTAAGWLTAVEAPRGPFAVSWAEEKKTGEIGGLRLHWRADRVDRLENGTVILDFKSGGRHGSSDWAGERPWDLQLPLYALLAEPRPMAVAFAKLKLGEMKFAGLAAADGLLPGCKGPEDMTWEGQLAAWGQVLERLAAEFLAGHAAVAPQRGACDDCGLEMLCRVGEKAESLEPEDDGGGE